MRYIHLLHELMFVVRTRVEREHEQRQRSVSGPFATRIWHHGSRAFLYPFDRLHPRIEIYDLNRPLQSRAMFPLIVTIPLPTPRTAPTSTRWR